jgi:oxygen-independent coproporphyrinogen-3 oxidase
VQTLGVYIQIPFCASKCSFCNFSSRVGKAALLEKYADAVEKEIAHLPEIVEAESLPAEVLGLPVDTLYVGGGTPSLLGGAGLRRIWQALSQTFDIGRVREATLEVTPGSADDRFLDAMLATGVNRLSVGAQSFSDRELSAVGRLHSAQETRDLVRRARRAGFRNISLDLIAGLPYQTPSSWQETLRATLDLAPEHVSVYIFEIDEKSRLGGEVLRHGTRYRADAVPGEEFVTEAYNEARRQLMRAGYAQYEISNFALPGRESLHNRKYWRLDPYIGIGAGAHSFDGVHRWSNEAQPEVYAQRLDSGDSPVAEKNKLSAVEQLEEFYFLGLRQRVGVDPGLARSRWGEGPAQRLEPVIARLLREGWLKKDGERIRLAEHALLISNEVFQEFLTV